MDMDRSDQKTSFDEISTDPGARTRMLEQFFDVKSPVAPHEVIF
jgi:hypothetical protein